MGGKLDFGDEDVQNLIMHFKKKYHPLKIYRVANVLFDEACGCDISKFRNLMRRRLTTLDLKEFYIEVLRKI